MSYTDGNVGTDTTKERGREDHGMHGTKNGGYGAQAVSGSAKGRF